MGLRIRPTNRQYFNPRSREGSDTMYFGSDETKIKFQSTLPRRERQGDKVVSSFKLQISIHAPAKGATNSEKTDKNLPWNFNPRSREGSDEFDSVYEFFKKAFQSTLPRRERLAIYIDRGGAQYFNPRSREGSDDVQATLSYFGILFQSTLPRRERRFLDAVTRENIEISIHAPAKGATLVLGDCIICFPYFNPRSREGSDMVLNRKNTLWKLFQSTLPRRERLDNVNFSACVT